jgi:Zn-dependent metalloprotease
MAKIKGLKAKLEAHPRYGVPGRIYDIETKPSKQEPALIAESLLKKIARDLKINPDLSQLKFDQVKESILGSHVLYQQYHEGMPISGAWIRVDIDKDGKVYNIQNDLVPDSVMAKTRKVETRRDLMAPAKQLSAEEAKSRALELVEATGKSSKDVLENELLYFPYNDVPTLAWKVIVKTTSPQAEWKMYLDAHSGAILDKVNMLKTVDGKGKVFDPNPVVTLNNTHLKDSSQIPAKAYFQVILKDLKNTGLLDGPFVSTRGTTKRVKRKNLQFLFTRQDRAFKEVMVYFHIDRVQRYIQDLGFNNVLNHPIEVNIDGETDDNSHYSPGTKSLCFGTGGIDDAEDAEIVLHEYGHAIQDNQVPGFGASPETGAMGEGFGAEPPFLRRLDSNKRYPKDIKGEVHDDGEIWSACLWELRAALGRKPTEILVIAHHFLISRKAGFEDAARALIMADKNLNHGANESVIRDVFVRRGILPNPKRNNKRAGVPFQETTSRK